MVALAAVLAGCAGSGNGVGSKSAAEILVASRTAAQIASDAHAQLTWGPAQAGVASGVLDAIADGTVASARADERVLVVAVWVASSATDPDAVYKFNRAATHDALRAGSLRQPGVGDVLAVRDEPFNAYWLPESMR